MSKISWPAVRFLSKTSSRPLNYVILSTFIAIVSGIVFSGFYQVESRIVIRGEVVSKRGYLDIVASDFGLVELNDLKIGQAINENDVLGFIKVGGAEKHPIRSLSSGKISKIAVVSAQYVKKDQLLVVVAPLEEEFELQLKIPTYEAGKIKEGQLLRAEIDAYPFQKFGLFEGQIFRIDQVVTREESSAFYFGYSKIRPDDQVPRSIASAMHLLQGMQVRAHIVLKRITILELVYEKLFLR